MLQDSKKERYNFKEFAIIMEEIKDNAGNKEAKVKYGGRSIRQEASLRDYNLKLSVAKYYRLDKTYKMLKNS